MQVCGPDSSSASGVGAGDASPHTKLYEQTALESTGCGTDLSPDLSPGGGGGVPKRAPYFCAGCPHNRSTRVPGGSFALGGIGCHTLALFMGRFTKGLFVNMGVEGANWIGLEPFLSQKHTFVNVGDGTYVHSAVLSIRACVAAKANMTFKILSNNAVAMTGGQV